MKLSDRPAMALHAEHLSMLMRMFKDLAADTPYDAGLYINGRSLTLSNEEALSIINAKLDETRADLTALGVEWDK